MEGTVDFSQLYERYYKKLFHISYSITNNSYTAEDIVHEAFIKAMNKVDTVQEEGKVGAWLSVIATRTAIDFVRREKKKNVMVLDVETLDAVGKHDKENVEQQVEILLWLEQMNALLQKMSRDQKDVLILRLTHGLKEKEIAELLHENPCTVKTRIHRARKKLKMLIKEADTA